MEKDFDLLRVQKLFQQCLDENLKIQCYIDGFAELNKLFAQLGGLFRFIVQDVDEKVTILSKHLKSPTKENYAEILQMIEYETKNDLFVDPRKISADQLPNGSRSLLRLHRSLLFIIKFTENILKSEEHSSMAPLAKAAYDNTIAQYHPWLIRKAVHLALYTLPTRKQLVLQLAGELYSTEQAKVIMESTVVVYNLVYDSVQKIYAERKLLDLP